MIICVTGGMFFLCYPKIFSPSSSAAYGTSRHCTVFTILCVSRHGPSSCTTVVPCQQTKYDLYREDTFSPSLTLEGAAAKAPASTAQCGAASLRPLPPPLNTATQHGWSKRQRRRGCGVVRGALPVNKSVQRTRAWSCAVFMVWAASESVARPRTPT